jgi:hypothetical protein
MGQSMKISSILFYLNHDGTSCYFLDCGFSSIHGRDDLMTVEAIPLGDPGLMRYMDSTSCGTGHVCFLLENPIMN